MSPPTFFRDYILLIFAYILLITCITPRAGIIRRKSCVFFLQEIYRLHTTLDYWDYSDWYVRVLAVKASHKWEPSSNGRVGSVPTYECSHQWPLSHLSSLFIRMQMAHLEQKVGWTSWKDQWAPKKRLGVWVGQACDEIPLCTISEPQTEGGRRLLAEKKERKRQKGFVQIHKKAQEAWK